MLSFVEQWPLSNLIYGSNVSQYGMALIQIYSGYRVCILPENGTYFVAMSVKAISLEGFKGHNTQHIVVIIMVEKKQLKKQ